MRFGPVAALAAASVLAFGASAANAAELLFSYYEDSVSTGIVSFSFEMSSDPTPEGVNPGVYTQVPVTDWSGGAGPNSSLIFWNTGQTTAFSTPNFSWFFNGRQIFSGTDADPGFNAGVYYVYDTVTDTGGTLTVTFAQTPEPATWALMLAGIAGLGAMLRRRAARIA